MFGGSITSVLVCVLGVLGVCLFLWVCVHMYVSGFLCMRELGVCLFLWVCVYTHVFSVYGV